METGDACAEFAQFTLGRGVGSNERIEFLLPVELPHPDRVLHGGLEFVADAKTGLMPVNTDHAQVEPGCAALV